MRILLFGKNGQVARSILEEAQSVHEITHLGSDKADLANPGIAQKAIADLRPEIVINATAYTAVDKAEEDESAANRLNAEAPAEMAKAAKEIGAHFIHISTDYVFDGKATAPYREDDLTNPLGVYGQTKLDGEDAVLSAYPEAIVIRTSWVFSAFGANFVKTMLRLAGERDTLNIVNDQIGGPTAARDIAHAILTIAGKKYRGAPGAGLYHYQGTPSVSWAEFAGKIFEIAGTMTTINPIPTKDFPTPAQRPLHTVLDCAKIERDFGLAPPDWRASLRSVMTALQTKDASS